MLWGSSRPGGRAEEFLVADLQRGRSRHSRTEGLGGGRRAGRAQPGSAGGRRRAGAVARARPCGAAPAPREASAAGEARVRARVCGPVGRRGFSPPARAPPRRRVGRAALRRRACVPGRYRGGGRFKRPERGRLGVLRGRGDLGARDA